MVQSNIVHQAIDDKNIVRFIYEGKIREWNCPVLPYLFAEKNNIRGILNNNNYIVDYEDGFKARKRNGAEVEVYKLQTRYTGDIFKLRKILQDQNIETFESDIPYARRLLLDKELEVEYYKDNVVYLDIEVDDLNGFPKEYGEHEILCIGCYDIKGREEYFSVKDNGGEEDMLYDFIEYLKHNENTIIAGWNIEFDYKHILERLRYFSMWGEYKYFGLCEMFDLKEQYENTIKGLTSYSLEEVSRFEKFEQVKHRDIKVSLMDANELKKYNLYDTELCLKIDEKYGFNNIELELCKFVNIPISIKSPIKVGDYLVINRLRQLGDYVAVDKINMEKEGYKGAVVLEPEVGMHTNVVYVDINSLYPNVIIHKKIDIDGFTGEIYPVIMKELLDKRAEMKRKYKETGNRMYDVEQQIYKILANSGYGLFGNAYFRYYNRDKAAQVTGGGREVLLKMKDFLERQMGAKVLYGDTDSEFASLSNLIGNETVDKKSLVQLADTVVDLINDEINPFAVKLEDVFKKILFFKAGSGGGAKKRYIALDYNNDYYYRGIELRKKSYCEFAKEVMQESMDKIFREELSRSKVERWLNDVKRDLFKGKYNEKLIISLAVSKKIEEYKSIPPHIRAYKIALDMGYEFIDYKVQHIYVKGAAYNGIETDVMPIFKVSDVNKYRIDYDRYWEKQIYAPVKRILDSIGEDECNKLDQWF